MKTYKNIEGTCEIELPSGEYALWNGLQYEVYSPDGKLLRTAKIETEL